MKIRAVGAELFHADRQTDKMKMTVSFGHFAKAPKNNPDKSYSPLTPFTHPTNFSIVLPSSHLYNEVQ
jgi:hypothetical protein